MMRRKTIKSGWVAVLSVVVLTAGLMVLAPSAGAEAVITVSSDTGLVGGQEISIAVSGFVPGNTAGWCQVGAGTPSEPPPGTTGCGTNTTSTQTVDSLGQINGTVHLQRFLYVPFLSRWVDCADPAESCGVGAADAADIDGTGVGLLLEFAPAPEPPVTRGTLQLAEGPAGITVTGSGFTPGAVMDVFQCATGSDHPSGCGFAKAVTTASPTGAFQVTVQADDAIVPAGGAEVLCTPRQAQACSIVAAEAVDFPGTHVGVPLPTPPPPVPRIIPTGDTVVEGDAGTTTLEIPVVLSEPTSNTVTVDWALVPPTFPNWSDIAAELGVDFDTPGAGTLTFLPGQTEATISITINGDEIEEPDELIVVSLRNPSNGRIGGFWGLGFGVIANDDVAPVPSFVVTPDTGVNGGQIVTVEGSGYEPGASIAICQAINNPASDPPEAGCLQGAGAIAFTTADGDGNFSAPYRLIRRSYVPFVGARVDCVVTSCVIGAVDLADISGTVSAVPLTFAEPPPPPTTLGSITVTPSVGLTGGETLAIHGEGFRADAVIDVHPCLNFTPVQDNCDYSQKTITVADATGAFDTSLVTTGFVFGTDCSVNQCSMAAAETIDPVGTLVSTPIFFGSQPYVPPASPIESEDFGADAIVIDFDELADGVDVYSQYADEGVVFDNARVDGPPNYAVSPPNAITCVEGNPGPVSILFPTGAFRVGIRIDTDGYGGRQPQARVFDAQGTELGRQNFAQGPDFVGFESPTPIAALRLGQTDPPFFTSFSCSDAYDDLIFELQPIP